MLDRAAHIVPGASYGVTIETAIRSCSVCLLILSPNALLSNAVESEIERAFHYQRTIIPLRIKNVEPGDRLALFISPKHSGLMPSRHQSRTVLTTSPPSSKRSRTIAKPQSHHQSVPTNCQFGASS